MHKFAEGIFRNTWPVATQAKFRDALHESMLMGVRVASHADVLRGSSRVSNP